MDLAVLFIALLALQPSRADSTSADSIAGVGTTAHAVGQRETSIGRAGYGFPSLMRYAFADNLTGVRLDYSFARRRRVIDFHEGTGGHRFSLAAQSFIHLTPRITTYGDAEYSNRIVNDVRWVNNSDSEVIYPYLAATAEGGRNRQSTYRFSGGLDLAFPFGTLGMEAKYRALQCHRTADPRPLNIVSDFRLCVGYSLPVGREYVLAAAARVATYRQSSDVSIYNKEAEPMRYIMNSVGSIFVRQYIMDSPMLYRLRSYGVTLGLRPKSRAGVEATAGWDHSRLRRYALSANVAPINYFIEKSWCADVQYTHFLGSWGVAAKLFYSHALRQGHDYILGSSAVREFRVLGNIPNYSRERITAGVRVAADEERSLGGCALQVQLLSTMQRQNVPRFDDVATSASVSLAGYVGIRLARLHMIRCEASVAAFSPVEGLSARGKIDALAQGPLAEYIGHTMRAYAAHSVGGGLAVRYRFCVAKAYLVEVCLRGAATRFAGANLEGIVGVGAALYLH